MKFNAYPPRAATLLLFVAGSAALGCAGADSGHGVPDKGEPTLQRPEFEAIADRLLHSENKYLGTRQLDHYEELLKRPGRTPSERVSTMSDLSREYLRVGNVDAAVAQIEQALQLAEESKLDDRTRADLLFARGTVYLRQAEVQNCIVRHNKDCCIFPLAAGGVHSVAEPADRARASFREYLKLRPDDRRVAWLLNVISMAAGDYPLGVPSEYVIPPSAFRSDHDIGRFVDVAPALGLDTFNQCGGVIADDFDGDGLVDIVTSTFDPRGPLTYYRNLGDGTFEDRSSASRLDDQLGGLNMIGGDYDNDGDLDILVLRGAWLFEDGRIRNSLLRNNGDGTFTDVTRQAGLAEPAYPTQSAVWGDLDSDGDLDLYVVSESPADRPRTHPAQLFRNDGDGTFTDVAAEAGVANHAYAKGAAAGDYDNDGDLDLYVSNLGPNRLYRNDGGLRFVDVAPELGVTEPDGRSFATWFFDYNNDGWLDLFVTGYDATLGSVYLDTLDREHGATPPCLYRNNGDGFFTNVAEDVGLNHAYLPMGANFGDADNDGWLDIYLSTGDPGYITLMPNVMLRNDAGRRFQDVTTSAGVGHLQKGHGVAFADFDNDGDQDLYHQLGGFYPGDRFQNAMFVNPGHGNHFLTVELRGTTSNARAVGARLKIVVRTPGGERELHRAVGSTSSFGGSPQRQEIGLGDATEVVRLEVVWPAPGGRQAFTDLPLDSVIRIVEGRDEYETLEPKRFDLKRAAERAQR